MRFLLSLIAGFLSWRGNGADILIFGIFHMNDVIDIAAVERIDENISLWAEMRERAREMAQNEPVLAAALAASVLCRPNFASAMSARIARKLASTEEEYSALESLSLEAFAGDPKIAVFCQNDIRAVRDRDPACESVLMPFLWFKGFLALSAHRVAHYFWEHSRRDVAHFIQSMTSEKLAVDIHPAAKFGCGILLDHATGFVAGETAVVENNVSILHAVTLGGTGKTRGDRHPKVRSGVLIGAGAKILGNIEIGLCAKVGAGSVVLEDVPAHATVAGVPAKIVGEATEAEPCLDMNHRLPC